MSAPRLLMRVLEGLPFVHSTSWEVNTTVPIRLLDPRRSSPPLGHLGDDGDDLQTPTDPEDGSTPQYDAGAILDLEAGRTECLALVSRRSPVLSLNPRE